MILLELDSVADGKFSRFATCATKTEFLSFAFEAKFASDLIVDVVSGPAVFGC